MIVSREYVPFKVLILGGDKGGELFTTLLKKSYPSEVWEQVYLQLTEFSLYERDMDWSFYHIGELLEGFRKLDQEEPYDTGYSLQDSQTAEVLEVDEKTIKLLLRTGKEQNQSIIGVIEVANTFE